MALISTKGVTPQKKKFHNEWISVYPTNLPLQRIEFWKENNRTIFTFERLCRTTGKPLEHLSTEEITQFVAEQDIHKLDVLAKSIGRNGVQVPLIIRDDGKLLDGTRPLHSGDLLNAEEIESGDISIYEEAGVISRHYTDELRDLFTQEFPELLKHDFILHRGVNTCMFACPILGIFTHGYEVDTVKPVFCFYVSKLFELIDDGAKCTAEQMLLFGRHENIWRDKRSEFITFQVI